ncbi:hypothetical protein ACRAWF_42000 [Streptomyces sp. L7]
MASPSISAVSAARYFGLYDNGTDATVAANAADTAEIEGDAK